MNDRIMINGMPVKEIKEIQDVLAAFQILNTTTETLLDEYKTMSAQFESSSSTHRDIINSLTEEQMKLQQLTSVIDKMSLATAHTEKEMLNMFQNNLQQKINDAFNRVDVAAMHRSLQQSLEKSLSRIDTSSIDKATLSMNDSAKKIDKLYQMLNNTLHQIKSGIQEYNDTVVNNFNKKAIIITGLIALLFGLSIGWIVKAEITAADYIAWTVPSDHRQFDDVKNANFMRFMASEAENRGDGYYYVKVKQLSR